MFKRKRKPVQPFTWERHRRRWISRFLFLGVPTLLWIILGRIGLISEGLFGTGAMVLAVLMFVAGLPVSLFIRLDEIAGQHTLATSTALLVGLGVVLVNFVVLGTLGGWIRQRRADLEQSDSAGNPTESKTQTKSKLNGSQLH